MEYSLTNNEKYLISLLKSILLGESIEEKPDDVSFEEVFKLSKLHNIANMTYYAIKKLEKKPEKNLLSLWKQEYTVGMIKDVTQHSERDILIKKFNEQKIKNVFLKGFALKALYPKNDMRIMGDLDILILEKDREASKSILEGLGYKTEIYGIGCEDSYIKRPAMSVEIHNNLFNESNDKFYNYFLDLSLMQKIEKVEGYSHNFSLEDNFLYNLAHIIKHFKCKGTGIRSVMDHWLYIKKYEDILDWEYINRSLKELEIYEFHKNLFSLGEVWFDNKESNELMERLGKYILSSGIYGNMENYGKNNMLNGNGILAVCFPRRKVMEDKFPILKKHKNLLFPYYFVRAGKILKTHGKDKVKRVFKSILTTNKTEKENIKKFYKDIGL